MPSASNDSFDRVGRVGVVDDYGGTVTVRDALESTGDLRCRRKAANHRFSIDPELEGDRPGDEGVVDIEPAGNREMGGEAPSRGVHRERRSVERLLDARTR